MSTNSGMIVVVKGPSAGLEVRLTKQETIIGRDERADLVFNSAAVSRRHARIILRDGQYFVQDLGSSNGTFVNGQRVQQSTALKDGDEIGLSQAIVMRFHAASAGEASSSSEASSEDVRTMMQATVYSVDEDVPATSGIEKAQVAQAQQAPDAPRLIVQVVDQSPQAHELHDEVITLGRAEDNDIVLPSRIVSRYHARLEKSGATYRLVVLPQVSNAVSYQGEALQEPRLLRHGDQLHIGQDDSPFQVTLTFAASQADGAEATAARTAVQKPAATQQQQAVQTPREQGEERTTAPPRFAVQIAGNPQQTFALDRERITIGRAEDNDIILSSPIVSRHHAYLERSNGGYRLVPLRDITNPLLYEGRRLDEPRRMRHEDKFRIGGLDPGAMVTMTYLSPAEAQDTTDARTVDFSEKTTLTLGRDDSNDIVVDNPTVSRYHAQIERVGQRYRVRDLRSSNGTFVNDERIEGEVWLQPDDTVRIGPYRFVVGQEALAQYDESGGLHVEAVGLNKWVREDLNILQDISLVFQPREFIVVVGQSGGGKSTLIDAVAGYRPATHGAVHVNDIDVYQNFDAVRNDIGYVPQRDIIHMELTVFQALDYSAQLRMPPDTTKEERHARIMEVLEDLDLAHRKDTQISELSGGQQKRVSIGVELLTKPGLFFLDEPTSGLDPGTETSLMQLMRRLADQGRTIVLITHATKNVMLADKVAFLARGGYLVWYGPPDEALTYFDKYRSERDRRARDIEFDEIYAILEDSRNGSPQEWAERFRSHPAYEKYIARPLEEVEHYPSGNGQTASAAAAQPVAGRQKAQISSLRQFSILSSRNIKILTRDKFSLALMLAAAPLVALLQVVLAAVVGANPFDFIEGNFAVVLIILFLPTVYAVMVGGLAQMREIVKEQDVYKRERLVNLRILPYVMSKIWVAALLALYQTACYILVHFLAFDMPGGVTEMLLMYFSLLLATMAGMMLGLFASSLAPNPNSAPLIVILFMVPQIVLGGALVPLPGAVTAPISTRWAFEAFMTITGAGSDVARDSCWDLPPEQRSELTLEQKDANCNCMGSNALDPNSCSFPGVGQFATAALDQPPPQEPGEPPAEPGPPPPEPGDPPARLGPQPEEPELPPQPERPEDEADQVAMANYFDALEAWQEEVETIQSAYRAELEEYQAQAQIAEAELDAYQEQVNNYQEALREYQATVDDYQERLAAYQESVFNYQTERATWEGERLSAIVPAESMIRNFDRDFGWTFVNKNDPGAYWRTLVRTWVAQSIIIGILFAGILVLQKRKDLG